MPTCPYCASIETEICDDVVAGTVYSWIVVHRAFQPAFEEEVPYTLVTVDLDGGGRLVGRLEPGQVAGPGMRVCPYFVDHYDWSEVRFRQE
jgi:uncharacterized OB-fold protein